MTASMMNVKVRITGVPPSFDPSSTTRDIVAALKQLGEACNPGNGVKCADGLTCGNINAEGEGICISSETPPAESVSEDIKSVDVSFTQALSSELDVLLGPGSMAGDTRDIFFTCVTELLDIAKRFNMTGPIILREATPVLHQQSLVLLIRTTELKRIKYSNISILNQLLKLFELSYSLDQYNTVIEGLDFKKFILDLAKLYRQPGERITVSAVAGRFMKIPIDGIAIRTRRYGLSIECGFVNKAQIGVYEISSSARQRSNRYLALVFPHEGREALIKIRDLKWLSGYGPLRSDGRPSTKP